MAARGVPVTSTLDYQRALGDRLRAIRRQQGMSLADVERRSGGTWKAVVVGAYERGDRAITIAKLARLTGFYGVPIRELLPDAAGLAASASEAGELPRVVIDLTNTPVTGAESVAAVGRLAVHVRNRRDDRDARVLTLRVDDVRALARAFAVEPSDLVAELERHGVLAAGRDGGTAEPGREWRGVTA